MKIIKLKDLGIEERRVVSKIFVNGFYQWFKRLSKDKQKLIDTFEHIFNEKVFYVALIDNNIIGIAACSYQNNNSIKLNVKEFQKNLGYIKGFFIYKALSSQFEKAEYPFKIDASIGLIEFVAVDENFRRKGVAKKIIKYIIENENFSKFALEVADTNNSAVELYKSLGFVEFLRKEQKYSKISGINNLLYMEYIK